MRGIAWSYVAVAATALASRAGPQFDAIVIPGASRDSMSAIWKENNRHWDELADVNTLTQLIGTGRPTQREYLGCLTGSVDRDTLWIEGLAPAANLRQLQLAVSGSCDSVPHLVGTWHTHPYRADSAGHALKERGLSPLDLTTFARARDLVTVVVWDVDSLEAAAKAPDGSLRHPAPLLVR
jgi:hypothetical protein